MDQLVLSWLGNRETNRANVVRERETERHNRATEKEAEMSRISNNLNQTLSRFASLQVAQTQAAATRYASDNARRAQEYAASTNAQAQRDVASRNASTSMWNTLQHEITSRSANVIQDRFNQGRLTIMASELDETKRANKAREQENALSRHQNMMMRDRELEFAQSKFQYQKEYDWITRGLDNLHKENAEKIQMMHLVTDLIGDGLRAYGYAAKGANSTKGVTNYGKQETYKTEEQQAKEFWRNLNEAFDREQTR